MVFEKKTLAIPCHTFRLSVDPEVGMFSEDGRMVRVDG